MHIRFKASFILFLAILTLVPVLLYSQNTVAVVEFKSREVPKETVLELYTNYLDSINSAGKFKVISPKIVNKYLKDKGLTPSDIFDKDNAIALGRSLRARKVITGNVNKYGKKYFLTVNITDIKTYDTITSTLKASSVESLKKTSGKHIKNSIGAKSVKSTIGRKTTIKKSKLEKEVKFKGKSINFPKIKKRKRTPPFLPLGKISVRTIKGVYSIKAGSAPETIKDDSLRGFITRWTNRITGHYRPQDVVDIKTNMAANKETDTIEQAKKCEGPECLEHFAKKQGARLIITSEISVERGTYYVFLQLVDVEEGSIINVASMSFSKKNPKDILKKLIPAVLELFEEYLFEPEKKIIQNLPDLGNIYIKAVSEGMVESGCDIYLNGKKLNYQTPYKLTNLPQGKHNFFVVKGFLGEEKTITIPTEESSVTFNLKPVYANTVRIQTKPVGAAIYLNGEYKGTSPVEMDNVLFGRYKLEIKKKDYEYINQEIDINLKKFEHVHKLRRGGILKFIDCPPGSRIYIENDEYNYEIEGNKEISLAEDKWSITVTAPKYKKLKDKVDVKARNVRFYSPKMCYTDKYIDKEIAEIREEQKKNWIWIWVGVGGFVTFTSFSIYSFMQSSKEYDSADEAYANYLLATDANQIQSDYSSHKEHNRKGNEWTMWGGISAVGALGFAGVATYYYLTMPGEEEIQKLEGMRACFVPLDNSNWYTQFQYSIRF